MTEYSNFRRVKHYFDKWRRDTDNEMWMVQQTNGLRQWVNTYDEDGKMNRINDFSELKNKIQDKLRQMGYSDVDELPDGVKIVYHISWHE